MYFVYEKIEASSLNYSEIFVNYERKLYTALNYKDMPMLMDYIYYCYYLSKAEDNNMYNEEYQLNFICK